jgi:branched-chain amino acid transport system substrate-binding protein
LTKIKELKPDAIFAGLLIQEAALLKMQMQELGMANILVFGSAGLDSETFNEIVGKAAEGTVINGQVRILPDSDFAKAYKAAGYAEPYETYGPFAYDATGIILEALKKVGPNRKAIVDYVNDPKFEYRGVTHHITLKNRQTLTGDWSLRYLKMGNGLFSTSQNTLQERENCLGNNY